MFKLIAVSLKRHISAYPREYDGGEYASEKLLFFIITVRLRSFTYVFTSSWCPRIVSVTIILLFVNLSLYLFIVQSWVSNGMHTHFFFSSNILSDVTDSFFFIPTAAEITFKSRFTEYTDDFLYITFQYRYYPIVRFSCNNNPTSKV